MLPGTIDGVIERLEGIIRQSLHDGDRAGYFAALYNRVTLRVREGIRGGEFEDNERMERLDVAFANRYLAAYDDWRAGEVPTRAWLQAFEATRREDLMVLQHLALGMNAHIDLDLGIAAARTSPGDRIHGVKGDFFRINDVLSSLVPLVEAEQEAISPILHKLVAAAGGLERTVADWGMSLARGGAWDFAAHLAPLAPFEQIPHIAERDLEVAGLGNVVLHQPAAMFMRLGESRDVRDNIEVLARGEFEFVRQ